MRPLALVVLGACSFSPGRLAGGDAATGDDGNDAPVTDAALDAALDAPGDIFVSPLRVRAIDITDAQVTGGPHADFPLLVLLGNEPWLRSLGNGGDVQRDDGFDIYFAEDQAGAMRLAHEVETYAPVSGNLVAWVRVPSLSPTTVIYLHYGDPAITTSQESVAAVWSSGYELVAHLDGGPDATGKNTLSGSALLQATGQIVGGRELDGDTSNLAAGSDTAIDNIFNGGGTAEAWFDADTFGEGGYGRLFDKGLGSGFSIYIDENNAPDTITLYAGCSGGNGVGAWRMTSTPGVVGAWHHIAIVYDSSAVTNDPVYYFDGAPIGVVEIDIPGGAMVSDADSDLHLGNNGPSGTRGFDGVLDEMRLSSTTRNAGWIATQYRNHTDPGGFYSITPL